MCEADRHTGTNKVGAFFLFGGYGAIGDLIGFDLSADAYPSAVIDKSVGCPIALDMMTFDVVTPHADAVLFG